MKKVRFRCPDCKKIVKIEGTDTKICPYCGWKDIKIRRKWNLNPLTRIKKNKSKIKPKKEAIQKQMEELE